MIGRIRGILLERRPPELLLDVQGVGYEIQAPMTTFYHLPETGAEVVLHTHFVVREDAQQLYGFHDQEERRLFRSLIRVSGVGPRVALAILSAMTAQDFVRHVNGADTAALVRVPGIGKKTAERLLVEMRDNLRDWHVGALPGTSAAPAVVSAPVRSDSEDAEAALIALGYRPQEAARMISRVLSEHDVAAGSEALIRLALRSLN